MTEHRVTPAVSDAGLGMFGRAGKPGGIEHFGLRLRDSDDRAYDAV